MTIDVKPALGQPEGKLPAVWQPALDRLQSYASVPRRWALSLILLLTALLNFYELQREGFANLYYAASIRSMLESWHNFFFVSFDPGGFVTVDKPPLGFWIQTASAKLLGYSGFSILLPEALAGIASVAVLYVLVRRPFGTAAGLLAALFLAITPVSVVTNRNNTVDSLLVLTILLAAYALSRAAENGSLRWLLLCALLVSLGFNIKMLEAFLVLPAFGLMYLLAAPVGWWRRVWHLAAATGLLLVVSLSWVMVVDLTPASARPYVGSSGSNSELALALGYNGIERLIGNVFRTPTQVANGTASVATSGPSGPGGASEIGAAGVFRLLNAQLGGQASWLLALGLIGVLATGWGVWGFRPRGGLRTVLQCMRTWRTSPESRQSAHLLPQQAALVLWGTWTLTMAVFFSIAGFFHRFYLSMLAPGIAALAGIGLVLLWRDYHRRDAHGWHGWLLPAALVVTAVTQAVIVADYSSWNRWMTPLIVGGSLVAAVALVALRKAQRLASASTTGAFGGLAVRGRRLPPAASLMYTSVIAAALGAGLLLVGPATWIGVSLANGGGGTLPAAGPEFNGNLPDFDFGPPGGFGTLDLPVGGFSGPGGGSSPANGAVDNDVGSQVNSALLRYLEEHQGSAKYLFATTSSQTAAPYIIQTGKAVMTLGGFAGADPILSVSKLRTLVREGQVHYFMLSGGFGADGATSNTLLLQWVEAHGTEITVGGMPLYYVSSAVAG